MRFYRLVIDGETIEDTTNNPQALQIRFDIAPAWRYLNNFQTIEIHNVTPKYWSNETSLKGKTIQFYAGMQAGLPLANPLQSGMIFSGTIHRAFKTLDGQETKLTIMARSASVSKATLPITIKEGDDFVAAVVQGMNAAGIKAIDDISAKGIIAKRDYKYSPADVSGIATELQKYNLVLSNSPAGFRIASLPDGSKGLPVVPIDYNDIIGQPAATDDSQIVLQTMLRADIVPTQKIRLPDVFQKGTVNPNPGTPDIPYLAQTGIYIVQEVRHIGDYRNATSAENWATLLTCIRVGKPIV